MTPTPASLREDIKQILSSYHSWSDVNTPETRVCKALLTRLDVEERLDPVVVPDEVRRDIEAIEKWSDKPAAHLRAKRVAAFVKSLKRRNTNWIKTSDQLPPEGKYVLCRHNRGTWHDPSDQDNVNCVVLKMKKGISMEERKNMKSVRGLEYHAEDEFGNNKVPYSFKEFGSDNFYGQTITHWMPIEALTDHHEEGAIP
jgi:hypothetical protein